MASVKNLVLKIFLNKQLPMPLLMTDTEKKRLAWRCRRGLLELDIVLQKFINNHFASLSEPELVQLDALLDYPDNDFWDLVSTRKEVSGNKYLISLLTKLRSADI